MGGWGDCNSQVLILTFWGKIWAANYLFGLSKARFSEFVHFFPRKKLNGAVIEKYF